MMNKLKGTFLSVLFGLAVAVVIGEVGLRISGYCKTYSERRDGSYTKPNTYDHKNIWWRVRPNSEFTISTPEFTIKRHINRLGFGDHEFEKRTDSNEVRILNLGDSFTFGDGAPADSSYPALLQGILTVRFPGRKITVLNGGTCGSDPVFGFVAYTRLLRDLVDPDIIIQAFHGQDITEDLVIRQGFERYVTDSTMDFKGIDFQYEPLYHHSHLARLYFRNYLGYNEFFINEKVRQKSVRIGIHTMQKLDQYWNDTLNPNQKFFYFLHPDVIEITQSKYSDIFQTVLDRITPTLGRIQVIDFGEWLVKNYHISKDSIYDLYWKKDGHPTPKGYSLMATSIADRLDPVLKERFK